MEWAVREKDSETTVSELSEDVVKYIRHLDDGYETTTARLVDRILRHKGYAPNHPLLKDGRYTRDEGKTYAIDHMDLMAIHDKVWKTLEGEIKLDFGEGEDLFVGLPYNIPFVIRRIHD